MSSQGERSATEKVQQAAQGAGTVATTAREAAKDTMSEAATQAKSVAVEAKDQVGRLAQQAADELRQQADERTAQASQGLRRLSTQIDALARGNVEEAGPLLRYFQDGHGHIASLADRLERRGAQGVLQDVRAFARRRPGLFLLCAAGAGLAVGRMVRANSAGAPAQERAYESDAAAYGWYDDAATYTGVASTTTAPPVTGVGEPGRLYPAGGSSGVEPTGTL